MENKYIKEFIILAETCNFQEASERVFISLSTMSKHISKMEEELGVLLFDRTTRKVQLTKYGIEFLKYAKQISKLCDEYELALSDLDSKEKNKLCIGFLPMLGQYGIVEMLSEFSKSHPGISLNMVEDKQPKDLLDSKKCDFVFDAEYGEHDSSIKRLLYKVDNLVAVFPTNHPLANKKYVTLEDLRDQNFIMHHDPVSLLPQYITKLCYELNFNPNVIMQVSFTSTITKLVSQGVGISVLNRMHTPTDNWEISIVDIHPTVHMNIYAYYLANQRMTPAKQALKDYIKEKRG